MKRKAVLLAGVLWCAGIVPATAQGYPVIDVAYIFKPIYNGYPGCLTLLVLDEAWLFLRHPLFREKIKEWLKTLGLIANPNQEILDGLAEGHGDKEGYEYALDILEAKGIDYKKYLKKNE